MFCRLGRVLPTSGLILACGLILGSNPVWGAEATVAELAAATQTGSTESRLAAIDSLADKGSRAKAAVPQLIKALGSDNANVRWHAARALGAMGPAAAEAGGKLAALLNDTDPRVRSHVAHALGRMGKAEDKYVPLLVEKITDDNPRVRKEVIEAIEHIHPGEEVVLPRLAEVLSSADPPLAMEAIKSLATYGKQALPTAINVLQKSPPGSKARYWACVLLGEYGPDAKEAVKPLTDALSDKDAGIRLQAALTLSQIGPDAKSAVPALVKALSDPLPGVQYTAELALANIGDQTAVSGLKKAATSKDMLVKTLAFWAIAKLDANNKDAQSKAIDALVLAMEDKRPDVRQAAAQALWDLKAPQEKIGPALSKALNDEDPQVVSHILDSLASLGEKIAPRVTDALGDPKRRQRALELVQRLGPQAKACVPALVKLLGDKDEAIQHEALLGLAAVGPEASSAASSITPFLASKTHRLVTAACFALGRMGPAASSATGEIEKQLKNESVYTQVAAAWALAQIETNKASVAKRVLPLLTEALKSDVPLLQSEAANTLGALGPAAKNAVPELTKLLDDPNQRVAQAATMALERIENKPHK